MARLPGDILRDIHLGLGALSPADKAEVAEVLVDDLSGMGRVNDRDLAHITPAEAIMLRKAGGAGTINPETGLPEYMGPGTAPGVSPGVGTSGPGSASGFGFGPAAAAVATAMGQAASTSSGLGSSGGMFGGYTYGGPPGSSLSPGSGTSPAASPFGWTPAEAQNIADSMADSGDAGTGEGFVFADTRGDTPADSPADSNVIVDKDSTLFDADRIAERVFRRDIIPKFDFKDFDVVLDNQDFDFDKQLALQEFNDQYRLDTLEPHYRRQKMMQRTKDMAKLINKYNLDKPFDLTKNIDNPYLPDKLNPEDRTVITTEDGKPILTRDLNPIDVPNLSIENAIHRYVTEAAKKNPTMYGLENYFKPYETVSEQLGFDRSSWLSRTEKAAKDSWVARQTSDLGSWISNNVGKVSDFFGDAPIMSFISRSPLGVIKSFIAEMLSKQTPALRDKTRMYLAAQSYAQRGLKIPEMSELAAHDFSGETGQPYLGEETFTDQWKTVPTLEKVEQLREEDRLEQERRLKGLEEAYRAEQLEELSKYFDTVSDEYLSLRDQPTYNPIGIEQLLGNT
jgi:hypothetical protein